MNLKKYLKKADKVDLATYKLALECQINDIQATINFLDKQSLKLMDIITENQKVVIDLEAERNQLKMLIKKDGGAI